MAAYEDPRDCGFDPELVKTALMSREQFGSKPRKLVLGINMGIAGIGICLMDKLNQDYGCERLRDVRPIPRDAAENPQSPK